MLSVSVSQQPLEVISTDKPSYAVGETVRIALSGDLTSLSLRIVSGSKTYNYGTLSGTLTFIPKTSGEYSIEVYRSGQMIDDHVFKVMSLPPIDYGMADAAKDGAATPRLVLEKDAFIVGDTVLIKVADMPMAEDYGLEIKGPERRYVIGSLGDGAVPFKAQSPGTYVASLIRQGAPISQATFLVSQKGVAAPPAKEESKPDPSPKEAAQLSSDKGKGKGHGFTIMDRSGKSLLKASREIGRHTRGGREFADLELDLEGTKVSRIMLKEAAVDTQSLLRIDLVDSSTIVEGKKSVSLFVIHSSSVDFQEGYATAEAKGTELWKCGDWDFENQHCRGSWVKLQDVIPGTNYTFLLSPQDSGFAETGVSAINSLKPVYHPGEIATLVIAVLDNTGYLTGDAHTQVAIRSPDGIDYQYSGESLKEVSRGIFSLDFPYTGTTGRYGVSVSSVGYNVNSSLVSFFDVKESYEFEIYRQLPYSIDPWLGPYQSTIRIGTYTYLGLFNYTEKIPYDFSVVKSSPGAEMTTDGSYRYLTWRGLANGTEVSYFAKAPLISPNLYSVGPGRVDYDGRSYDEGRPWYLAIDPTSYLLPNQDGAYTTWVIGGTTPVASRWDSVNDPVSSPDDGVTLVYTDASNSRNSFGFQNLVSSKVIIDSVAIRVRGNTDSGGTGSVITLFYRQGTTDYSNPTTQSLSTTYQTYGPSGWNYTQNPATSQAWTFNDINNMEWGVFRSSGNRRARVTQIYAIVGYRVRDDPPEVTLLSKPANLANIASKPIDFNFTVKDDFKIQNCSLYMNISGWTVRASSLSVPNNTNTKISHSPPDGSYTWNIRCWDNATIPQSDYYTNNFSFVLDSTPPTVKGLQFSPAQKIVNLPVIIRVNVSDSKKIDKVEVRVTLPNSSILRLPMADSDKDGVYDATLYNTRLVGQYSAMIYANDTFSNLNSTTTGTFSVSLDSLSLTTGSDRYVIGEQVKAIGKGFNFSSDVDITIYDPTGDPVGSSTVATNLTGGFTFLWDIVEGSLLGTYRINATDRTSKARSAVADFEVVSAIVEAGSSEYEQGETVVLSGFNWDANADVTINVSNPSGMLVYGPTNLTSDSSGDITGSYPLPYDAIPGIYSIHAYEPSNPSKMDTGIFMVKRRPVQLALSYPWYWDGESVGIAGTGFSPSSDVTVSIYDPSNALVPGYPKNVSSDSSGALSDTYLLSGMQQGQYSVVAYDFAYRNLNSSASFLVAKANITTSKASYNEGDKVYIVGSYWRRGSKVTISIQNQSYRAEAGYPLNITANSTGGFVHEWTARGSGTSIAYYNATSFDPTDIGVKSHVNFSVTRKSSVVTDKDHYVQKETVNITGGRFTPNSLVSIKIIDKGNGGNVLGYPRDIPTDLTGGFTHIWNITDYCAGTYSVIGTDKTSPLLFYGSKDFEVMPWWNPSWTKRRPLIIDNPGPQITNKVIWLNATGLSSQITRCDRDLRIISTLTGEAVPYDVLNGDNSTFCEIVFVASASGSQTGESNYYLYYGNPAAADPGYSPIAYTNTTRYDFANYAAAGHTAYYHTAAISKPPASGPAVTGETAYDAARYLAISYPDSSRADTGTSKSFRTHRFSFQIAEQEPLVTGMAMYWSGYTPSASSVPVNLYAWNYDSTSWVNRGSHSTTAGDDAINGILSSGPQAFIASNIVTFLVETQSYGSGGGTSFYTNYAYLDVIHDVSLKGISRVGGVQSYFPCRRVDVTAPSVSIISPPNHHNTSDSTPAFSFRIRDDMDLSINYSIFVDGLPNGQRGMAANNTITNLDLTTLSQGTHSIAIKGTDDYSNSANSTIFVTIDYTGPTLTLTSPINHTNISTQSFEVIAAASDAYLKVDSVMFIYRENSTANWKSLCKDNTLPYRCIWSTSNMAEGATYQVAAYANDSVGNIGNNQTAYNIKIDRTGPTTAITDPIPFQNMTSSTYNVMATSSDLLSSVGTVYFMYRRDPNQQWSQFGQDGRAPYQATWDMSLLPDGNSYQIRSYGIDVLGNTGPSHVVGNITLDRTPPYVSRLSVQPMLQYLAGGIRIEANVTDLSRIDTVEARVVLPDTTILKIRVNQTAKKGIFNFTYLSTLQAGTYQVRIFSNDSNGISNLSSSRSFFIDYYPLGLSVDRLNYVVGETVSIEGQGFSSLSNVTLAIQNSTGSYVDGYPKDIRSNSTGHITSSWLIPADAGLGQYVLNATDTRNKSRSVATGFEIVTAIVRTGKVSYEQGEVIHITGNSWDPDSTIMVNITGPSGAIVFGPLNLTSNSTGHINATWQSGYGAALGNYRVYAYQPSNPQKSDDADFIMTRRPVSVWTDHPWYKHDETVQVSGEGFSPLASLTIDLKDTFGVSMPGYPKAHAAGALGSMSHSFPVSGFSFGAYHLNITDQAYPNLWNSTSFIVVNQSISSDKPTYINGEVIKITGLYWDRSSPVTLDIENSTGQSLQGYPKNITSGNDGTLYSYLTAQSVGLGLTNFTITAYNPQDASEKATNGFSVLRIAILKAERSEYDQGESLRITGDYFTNNGAVALEIKEADDDKHAYYYPKRTYSASNGSFSHVYETGRSCMGTYVLKAQDLTVPSLSANYTFNITHLEPKSLLRYANQSTLSGIYDTSGGTYLSTIYSDNTYQYIGAIDIDGNVTAYLNYTFNLSGSSIDTQRIRNLTVSLEFCHSGSQVSFVCDGTPDDAFEGYFNRPQPIEIFNASGGEWKLVSSIPGRNDTDDTQHHSFYVDDLAGLVSGGVITMRFGIDIASRTASDDAFLLIDQIRMDVGYRKITSKACEEFTNSSLDVRNYDGSFNTLDSTEISVYNASTGELIDSDNETLFRYLPAETIDIKVHVAYPSDNVTLEILGLDYGSALDVVSAMSEDYVHPLPYPFQSFTPMVSLNDSRLEFAKARISIPKRGKEVNTIIHCLDYNYSNGECLDFEYNETDELEFVDMGTYIELNVTSFDSFGGGSGATLPNVTAIRVFNVTGRADTHKGGTLTQEGISDTFSLTSGDIYRIEFDVRNLGRGWTLDATDVVFHQGLNASWGIRAADIWYVDGSNTTNYTGGTFSDGKVSWNPGLGGRLRAGEKGAFYYVLNVTTESNEDYNVRFLVNDTSTRSGSFDDSVYRILNDLEISLVSPAHGTNVTGPLINFTWVVEGSSLGSALCNLSIDGELNTSGIDSQMGEPESLMIRIGTGGMHVWDVTCSDILSKTGTSPTGAFFAVLGPSTLSISVEPDNTSLRLNWSETQGAESYSIYYTDNLSRGFGPSANISGLQDLNWTDGGSVITPARFYKVAAVRGGVVSLSEQTLVKFRRGLDTSWNLISLPMDLPDFRLFDGADGSRISTDPGDCIETIWRFNITNDSFERTDNIGGSWMPATGSESFVSLDPGQGYWYETSRGCNVTFAGVVPVRNSTIAVDEDGWNMVGWHSVHSRMMEGPSDPISTQISGSISTALRYNESSPKYDKWELIIYLPGYGWLPLPDENGFDRIEPTKGYYFDSDFNDSFTVDPTRD